MKTVLSKEEQYNFITQFRNNRNSMAFAKLYEFYFEFVYGIAWHYMRDKDNAFDVAQDTFILVYQKISQLQNVKYFKFWISTISRNLCITQLRKIKRNREINLEEYSLYTIGDVDSSFLEEKITKLNFVMDILEVAEKELIYQKYYQSYKISEIAKELNVSESAIKMRLQRAKNKIKKAS